MAPAAWTGVFEMGSGWAIWRGAVGEGEAHRHIAAQAVFAPEPVGVEDANGRVAQAACVLIDPLAVHRLRTAPSADLVYVEPSRRRLPDVAELMLAPARASTSVVIVRRPGVPSFWGEWLSTEKTAGELESRVERAIVAVDSALPEAPPLSKAAASANLSVERFRRLFAQEVGLTYGRYVLWARLRLAAAELTTGRDATKAAHAAGFADAAHFARTLKTTFGVTASQTLLAGRRSP